MERTNSFKIPTCSFDLYKWAYEFNNIYFYGEPQNQETLVADIKRAFSAKITHYHAMDTSSLGALDNFFSINLLRNHAFSLKQRERIFQFIHLILFLLIGISLFLQVRIFVLIHKITTVKSSYTSSEYSYAQELKTKLDSKQNAK